PAGRERTQTPAGPVPGSGRRPDLRSPEPAGGKVRCGSLIARRQLVPPRPSARVGLSLNPQPSTLNPQTSTLNPQPSTLNPQPSTLNPQPSTLNPQPSTVSNLAAHRAPLSAGLGG
ncbi:hypothetical protein T484DRAFT_3632311, partial [Baffinella frigidus]